ncbi:hypothetical protein GQ44DRAFT_765935 [Phaeosphaeriaceae sp. PMI808]|nr:hypothetical protein GQ44DRAFT_765935 [Phaeosphaeriaceae sp. PMI808]
MALGANLTTHPPLPRIPKLKYRNPLPTDQDPSPLQSPCQLQVQHCNPQLSLSFITLSSPASSLRRPSFDTVSLTSPSLASTASSLSSSNDSKSSRKKTKKTSSVLGFLSLKEPSQLAFEQYAKAQRKNAAEKGISAPISSPSTSLASKKLPKNIPKVNSRWNGVPETTKRRNSRSSGSNKDKLSASSKRDSQDSQSTSMSENSSRLLGTSDSTRNPPNSLASFTTSVSNLNKHEETWSSSPLPSPTGLPQVSFSFEGPVTGGALDPSQIELPYSPITETYFDPLEVTPDMLVDQLDALRASSPASSTDSVDTVVRDTAEVVFQKLNDRPRKSFWGDASMQTPEDSFGASIPESHDFLFDDQSPQLIAKADSPMTTTPPVLHQSSPRQVLNFSRPISSPSPSLPRSVTTPPYRNTPASPGLPTLYEASLASTEPDETIQDDRDADTYSIAPSTIAPSVLSATWHESPRERLGLGGRLRMNDVLPWESQRESPSKLKKYRLSMFGKAAPKG